MIIRGSALFLKSNNPPLLQGPDHIPHMGAGPEKLPAILTPVKPFLRLIDIRGQGRPFLSGFILVQGDKGSVAAKTSFE
jgi:hypothetical protein